MASMETVISLLCGSTITVLYSTVFRTVVALKLNNTNIVFDNEINVNVEEMKTIVNGLACNKSHGLDGVSAEHMKFAGPKLCVGAYLCLWWYRLSLLTVLSPGL